MLVIAALAPGAQGALAHHRLSHSRGVTVKSKAATAHRPSLAVSDRAGEIVYPGQLGRALVAAESYWGVIYPPLCETAEIILAFPATPDTAGEATLAQAPGEDCSMDIRPNLVEPQLCPAVVHEYGHWLGFEHTQNPADVMYEDGPWWAAIPECESPGQ
jgi:hypothetical protein